MNKPMPLPTPVSRPFWDALRQRQVQLQRCDDCQQWVFYPRSHCPHCLSRALSWQPVSGKGVIYSFCVSEVPSAPMFADEVPQRLVIVELEEGVRLCSTLVVKEGDELKVGMPLVPLFEDRGDITLLRYQPA